MSIQSIQTYKLANKNYTQNVNANSLEPPTTPTKQTKYLSSAIAKSLSKSSADSIVFGHIPVYHETTVTIWKLHGSDILSASSEKIKELAEYFHKDLPSAIYTVFKEPNFWGTVKEDKFQSGIAYNKLKVEIVKVLEKRAQLEEKINKHLGSYPEIESYKKEIERLDKKAAESTEKFSEDVKSGYLAGY